jgi:hypothetical protein
MTNDNGNLESLIRHLEEAGKNLQPDGFSRYISSVRAAAENMLPAYLNEGVGVAYVMFNCHRNISGKPEIMDELEIRSYLPKTIRKARLGKEVVLELENGTKSLPRVKVASRGIEAVKKFESEYGPVMSIVLRYPNKTNVEAARALSRVMGLLMETEESPLYDNDYHGDVIWQADGHWESTLTNPRIK